MQEWQRGVLDLEKTAVVAVRSYRAMIREGRASVGLSDIFTRLTRDPMIKWYFGRADGDLLPKDISRSLLQESLGAVVGKLFNGEELFCRRSAYRVQEQMQTASSSRGEGT